MSGQQVEEMEFPQDIEQLVADHLAAHPTFFENHISLLESLVIPHSCGSAVSLIERQISSLRDSNSELNKRLHSLVRVARENEQLSIRMQRLTMALVESQSLDETLSCLSECVRGDFQTDGYAIRIYSDNEIADLMGRPENLRPNTASFKCLEPLMNAKRPTCGNLDEAQLTSLYGDHSAEISSSAIVPLRESGFVGLLAIGSKDESRFQRGLGTLFLGQLGELVSCFLKAKLQPVQEQT